ncbi:MAG: hypothetical protein JNL58_17915 [Planctomyces sp.]|nr:hypothetical protein [Planctomyces sp.]
MSEQGLTPARNFSQTSRIVLSCGLAMVMLNRFEPAPQVADKVRCVLVEVYHDGESKDLEQVKTILQSLKAERNGITVVLRETEARDQAETKSNAERRQAIARHFGLSDSLRSESGGVMVYGCNKAVIRRDREFDWQTEIEKMLQIEVFVRSGCSRCASAKLWIRDSLTREYPGLKVVYRDLAADATSMSRLTELVERHKTAAASVPVFHLCDSLIIGFDDAGATRDRIRSRLKKWSHECAVEKREADNRGKPEDAGGGPSQVNFNRGVIGPQVALGFGSFALRSTGLIQDSPGESGGSNLPNADPQLPELPLPELPVPDSDDEPDGVWERDDNAAVPGNEEQDAGPGDPEDDRIEVPVFGSLSAGQLGMPLFTVAIGLVDGFNPCAMWVLLFLLSILVNLKDRTRILAIAGTFVFISGVAYFLFMAAWLNVFLLIGYLRPIQIGLGLMAVVIGGVHIKDFFALHRGISFSIPETAKPGIYERVRRIVTAESLKGAIAGAVVLAILVNLIELLCTAGLPALYTNILTQQGYSAGGRYLYLGLYILAYMFDDSLMVGAVVITMSRRRLQESHGRWLKLLSGTAILVLGIIMLIRPDWLH